MAFKFGRSQQSQQVTPAFNEGQKQPKKRGWLKTAGIALVGMVVGFGIAQPSDDADIQTASATAPTTVTVTAEPTPSSVTAPVKATTKTSTKTTTKTVTPTAEEVPATRESVVEEPAPEPPAPAPAPAEEAPVQAGIAAVTAQQAPPVAPAASYQNCTAVWNAIGGPIYAGDPGFQSKFDGDSDGVGCENRPS